MTRPGGPAEPPGLVLCPLTLREANAFVRRYHRHHGPARGMRFALGAAVDGTIVAVAIVGRPLARARQEGAEELRPHLQPFAQHRSDCAFIRTRDRLADERRSCTCGLAGVLAARRG